MNVADPSPKEQAERLRRKNALLELMEEIARASNEAEELVENVEEAQLDSAPDSEEEATHLYRIAQESVNNARRHGEADAVEIRLRKTNEVLLLTVEDAGTGFRSDEVSEGLGLRSMQHRAELLGADLQMESQPGEGALVQCRLPL